MTYDGSGKPGGVKLYVNGADAPLRATTDKLKADAETRTNTPLRLGQRSTGMFFEDGQVQDLRLFTKRLTPAEAASLHQLPALNAALAAGEKRKPEQTESLFANYLATRDKPWQDLNLAVVKLEG